MGSRTGGFAAVAVAAMLAAGSASAQEGAECGVYVFFNSGQVALGQQSRDVLLEYARTYPGAELAVTGYTDAAGSAAANQALAQQRARNVAAALPGTSITSVVGVGEAVRPGTSGATDPLNRRVEVIRADCTGAGAVPTPLTANAGLAAGVGVGVIGLGAALAGDDDDDDGDSGTGTPGT
ncbi:putative outer membrane lipoprotein [Roseivivax jejudonensis]|uniref:Putative outer membrane lipoprotein n=1 Tax=Roseivivax jejudonensis TaxID=1529041 RepID=A0A1X7A0F8_9RHOB|nr:OmpA family protein [Roseivivax jejudonensis]SLN67135.1 putative outer membrane lipoprotein [Roseivivax jejudonensis]